MTEEEAKEINMKAGIKYLRKLGKKRRNPARKIVFDLHPNPQTLPENDDDSVSLVQLQNQSD